MDRSLKFSVFGLVLAIGLVFGDIGTSPLYVLRAISANKVIDKHLIYGSLSLIFWTLTIVVSIKYVIFVLRADNQGEGGILAIYNLVKRRGKIMLLVALLGLSSLVAEAVITPAISVMSAVEGLRVLLPQFNTTIISIFILVALFVAQNVGSSVLGRTFGLTMILWFLLLAVSGLYHTLKNPSVFLSINPKYALNLLLEHPDIWQILGAVFLCITGVEALYSDLGHAGRTNIRVAWVFVKCSLLLHYFGQGAYLLKNYEGLKFPTTSSVFYELFSPSLLPIIIPLATASTIIASQAVISGLFSLVSSAISLNLLPKLLIKYPGDVKGQLFIPVVNYILGIATISVVLVFENSWNLEHAYGLSVNLTLICTSILFLNFLDKVNQRKHILLLFVSFLLIEILFLRANLVKFFDGAYFTLFLTLTIYLLLYSWNYGYSLMRDTREFVELKSFLPKLVALSKDEETPIFSDNLVYLTESSIPEIIESRVIYSIFRKRPKRALTYFFVHLEVTDRPHDEFVEITPLKKGVVYNIRFKLGFKVRPNLQKRFNEAYDKLVKAGDLEDVSGVKSLKLFRVPRSITFVVLSKQPYIETDLTTSQSFFVKIWKILRESTVPRWKYFDLDESLIYEEKVPAFAKLPGTEVVKRLT